MKKSFVIFALSGLMAIAGAVSGATTHTITTGDTLWELAAKHYGDPTLYPILLQVNNIDNPRTILNGTVIIIPNKSDMKKIADETDPAKKKALISKVSSGLSTGNDGSDKNPEITASSPDKASRVGEVNPNETSFENILKGPKVSADKLIKVNNP